MDISADQFENIKTAKRNLLVLLGIEEKFEMVIDNYRDYEHALFDLALADITSRMADSSSFYEAGNLITRRLANCLTLGRLYEDQVGHDLATVYSRTADVRTQIIGAFREQSKRLLGYRTMKEVRNCLQHRSLPLKQLAWRRAWEEHNGDHLRHHRLTVQLDVRELRNDRKAGSRELIEELERNPTADDTTLLLRQYVEGLSCVHKVLRAATEGDIEVWKSTLRGIIQRYSEAGAQCTKIVVAFKRDDESALEEVYVVADMIDRFEQARVRLPPIGLSRTYASNAPL